MSVSPGMTIDSFILQVSHQKQPQAQQQRRRSSAVSVQQHTHHTPHPPPVKHVVGPTHTGYVIMPDGTYTSHQGYPIQAGASTSHQRYDSHDYYDGHPPPPAPQQQQSYVHGTRQLGTAQQRTAQPLTQTSSVQRTTVEYDKRQPTNNARPPQPRPLQVPTEFTQARVDTHTHFLHPLL
jgi:hypothetical protein